MSFVIGVITTLFIVFLLAFITIKKPAFGKTIIALSLAMVVLASVLYFQNDQQIEHKKHLIALDDIALTNIQYQLAYGNYYKLTAQLSNHSKKYRLQAIELAISFYNCPSKTPKNYKKCQLIATKIHKIPTRLAAQQSTTIESYFLLDDENILHLIDNTNKEFLSWDIQLANGYAR